MSWINQWQPYLEDVCSSASEMMKANLSLKELCMGNYNHFQNTPSPYYLDVDPAYSACEDVKFFQKSENGKEGARFKFY